jgi:hypothetical protein
VVNQTERDADHLHSSNAQIKNVWSFASIPHTFSRCGVQLRTVTILSSPLLVTFSDIFLLCVLILMIIVVMTYQDISLEYVITMVHGDEIYTMFFSVILSHIKQIQTNQGIICIAW